MSMSEQTEQTVPLPGISETSGFGDVGKQMVRELRDPVPPIVMPGGGAPAAGRPLPHGFS